MPVVGMVGGGQLARMTAAAAVGLGATFRVLSESGQESAALVTHDVTVGSHLSLPDISAFAGGCDVITFDHEHVPGSILAKLESDGVLVRPGSGALKYTQDKLAMRERLLALGVPCPRFAPVSSLADVVAFASEREPKASAGNPEYSSPPASQSARPCPGLRSDDRGTREERRGKDRGPERAAASGRALRRDQRAGGECGLAVSVTPTVRGFLPARARWQGAAG
jgi:formate-dependent phosphoribosylglycinamide formyltransferase (GAR transformylase)